MTGAQESGNKLFMCIVTENPFVPFCILGILLATSCHAPYGNHVSTFFVDWCKTIQYPYMYVLPLGGLPFSTYAPRGVGGVKPPIYFHCVLHAKKEVGGSR